MRIKLSRAQYDVLGEAAAGSLSRSDEQHAHWRVDLGAGITKAVTPTARNLLDRGLIAEDTVPNPDDGRIYAFITDLGVVVLDELDSRGPTLESKG